ncbi:salt stress protein, Slr1339 family [Brunnivagina elsteri]|uniref:Uncharacterized protein n=1 Tax=Brunnivagina elsteri CCALA 953 TaxID=987040 RepID=A0A2A2TG67_9CYAN|nr:hypothetical protein [Calothrix elsteri]PAX52730.1 hypothetical protein CK510_17705 [Calothrix elsteri CCALA 953]
MDEIDKLLKDLKQEYSENKPKTQQPNPLSVKPNSFSTSNSSKTPQSNSGVDKLLDDVKADFQQKDLAKELQRQEEIEAENKRQEEIKLKQKQTLEKQAKTWLEQLEPLSQEGLWFEKFAEGYPSNLEAAIEYLQGLETDTNSLC